MLYTEQQRVRRDQSPWTIVQAILAPAQFLVCLASAYFVIRYLLTGDGYAEATFSIFMKTGILYLIMVTGAIWEKHVFGQYLFAPAFYWEDMVSMLVLALHTAYLISVLGGFLSPTGQMILALMAYTVYGINAAQFLLKLRQARLESNGSGGTGLQASGLQASGLRAPSLSDSNGHQKSAPQIAGIEGSTTS